jgi:putative ATPase
MLSRPQVPSDLHEPDSDDQRFRPLADRMRPSDVSHLIGQRHVLSEGKPLARALETGVPHSMVFWGPPGTGKTTLARLLAERAEHDLVTLSAVLSGVKDVRAAVETARATRQAYNRGTILFVDEVHRFNKAQQDSFLPHIEDGTIIFIGATTENPSFELNNALLSRLRVYPLKSLDEQELLAILEQAVAVLNAETPVTVEQSALAALANAADGDARRAINLLELASELADDGSVDDALINQVLSGGGVRRFDKGGDDFYDQISALHKSVRGSAPDAALYWCARMMDGGCDPSYIARRLVRIASEDIGNADPRALQISLDAWNVFERLGTPEGELAIAQATAFLACAPKSNAVYKAFGAAQRDAQDRGSLGVPPHLRNAPTKLAEQMGHGAEYRYAHDEEGAYAAGETYFPEELGEQHYYHPVNRGLEIKIGEKLERLRALDAAAFSAKRKATGAR